MRQFVADASHELRTPLATVRGYAELYRQGAVPTAAAVDRRDGAHRGRVEPDERARRGPAHAGPDRRRARVEPAGRPHRPGGGRRRRRPRPRARAAHLAARPRRPGRADRGARHRVPAAPGGDQPRRERPAAHPGRHRRRGGRRARRRPASPSRCATTGPGVPDEARPRSSSASTAPTPRVAAAAAAAAASGWRSSRRSWRARRRVGVARDPGRRRDVRRPAPRATAEPPISERRHLARASRHSQFLGTPQRNPKLARSHGATDQSRRSHDPGTRGPHPADPAGRLLQPVRTTRAAGPADAAAG